MEKREIMSGSKIIATMLQRGFTLVELLVVIAILSILVALLLPAIQAARESARMAQCKNNLRQIGLGILHYENTKQEFPAGGWSSSWTGDPNVRTGSRQPGGWIYQSLPYLEQRSIANIGLGLTGGDLITTLSQQGKAVISLFNCPSRRPAQLYPVEDSITWNFMPLDHAAKTDYAANGGSTVRVNRSSAPTRGIPFVYSDCRGEYPNCRWMNSQSWIEFNWNGIVGDHSGVQMQQITDGSSRTLLTGEKWLFELYYHNASVDAAADNETNGMAADNPGDDGSMYAGFDYDNVRACSKSLVPKRDSEYDLKSGQRDKKGDHFKDRFGSAHVAGVNISKCDGSVDTWIFEVDSFVWSSLGARNDGEL